MASAIAASPPPTTHPAEPGPSLQCMEVWGGNQAIDTGLSVPGLDVRIYSRPYGDQSREGGDVHYISQCGTGRIGRFLIADVSGHGPAVADVARTLRGLMRRFVNYVDQAGFVSRINREFSRLASAGNFATAVVITYWAPTDYLLLCNAGHPRPFWYRRSTGRWEVLESHREAPVPDDPEQPVSNLPLGILEPTTYDQVGLRLSPGDLVLVYTDALVEAKDPSGRLLGEAGLAAILADLDPARPDDLIPALRERIDRYRAGGPAEDDTTILLLRHNGSRPARLSLREWIPVAGRFLSLAADSLRHRTAFIPWPQLRLDNVLGAFLAGPNNRLGGSASPGERARLQARTKETVRDPPR